MNVRTLRRGVILNGIGWFLPALIALASVPALTRILGAERFGLLALAWAAVAAFAVLDLGVGRAVSFLVADRATRGLRQEVPALLAAAGWSVWLALAPLAALGLWVAPWLVASVFDIPLALHAEGGRVVRLLAASVPFVVHGIVLRSAFEGEQRFFAVNVLRVPLGLVTWGGPWIAALFTQDVSVLVAVIVGGRVLYWAVQWLWLRSIRGGSATAERHTPAFGALWRAGGWMTVSGLVSPILVLADRALLPIIAPIAAVGWYVAAGEAATKLWIFPSALQPVLFPALTAAAAGNASEKNVGGDLMSRATRATGGALLPVAVLLVVFAEPILKWWLNVAFAPEAVEVFRLFVTAVYLNSIALVAYSALQAGGHARAAARLHLVELPIFLVALLLAAREWGAMGAALVWSLRLIVDGALMWRLALVKLDGARIAARPALVWGVGGAALFAGLALVRVVVG